jgi:hypothetical protein
MSRLDVEALEQVVAPQDLGRRRHAHLVEFRGDPRALPRAPRVHEIEGRGRLPEAGMDQPPMEALAEQLLRGIARIEPARCRLAWFEGDSLEDDNPGDH